jgi:hypothetical protein
MTCARICRTHHIITLDRRQPMFTRTYFLPLHNPLKISGHPTIERWWRFRWFGSFLIHVISRRQSSAGGSPYAQVVKTHLPKSPSGHWIIWPWLWTEETGKATPVKSSCACTSCWARNAHRWELETRTGRTTSRPWNQPLETCSTSQCISCAR